MHDPSGERDVYLPAGDGPFATVLELSPYWNTSDTTVHMLLVENSPLLQGIGVNRRESAGNIPYKDLPKHGS